jgi:CRISPR-associated endonuclease/helicase Cas3
MMEYYAHSHPDSAKWQKLVDHLRRTAGLAQDFAADARPGDDSFRDLAHCSGLLHDLGKYTPEFQAYLKKERDGDVETQHAIFGAALAAKFSLLGPTFASAGHHAGLHDTSALQSFIADPKYRLDARLKSVQERFEADVGPVPSMLADPEFVRGRPLGCDYYVRMLFSCLVDADYLDTERACTARVRAPVALSSELKDLLIQRLLVEKGSKPQNGEVNRIRHRLFDRCLTAARGKPGFFTLTVPTGGGKTLSGMAFALAHARAHNLRRVIVVIPYLSIIEQNAATYRAILDPDDQGLLVEHHSGTVGCSDENSDRSAVELETELATENWDAPVIVTTSVQFIESLFANRPSACRKLHNVARSVVVLDEVQTLPTHLLAPLLSVCRELKEHYGTSFVFSTATQPAFRRSAGLPDGFAEAETVEIAGSEIEIDHLFHALDRVKYERLGTLDWNAVAAKVVAESRALCVVNTRGHAFTLWELIRDALPAEQRDSVFHLSSALCAEHRSDILGRVGSPQNGSIRHRLLAGLPCRVVSTQVVEAGVDLDFPAVLRAMAPLDSIVQAAGRCNREGKLPDKGRVGVFSPENGGTPPGVYKTATGQTAAFLAGFDLEHRPLLSAHFADYFGALFNTVDTDYARRRECGIQEDRECLRFREVARKAKVITDDTMAVVVPYRNGEEIIREIRERDRVAGRPRFDRQDMRRLQRYMVNLRRKDFLLLESNRAVTALLPNLDVYVLDKACYHAALGVIVEKLPTEDLCGA